MSKIKNQYTKLKNENGDILYLFKSGTFYIAIEDDAKLLNEKLNLKITNLGNTTIKCGFPIQKIENYKAYFKNLNINYKLIDSLPKDVNINDYLKNIEIKNILNEIKSIDINTMNSIQALNFLNDVKNKIKKL